MTRRFREDNSGNVAIVFSLALLPLMGLAGAALDYSRATQSRTRLQATADAAALKAVLAHGVTDQERIAIAQSVFKSAGVQFAGDNPVTVTIDGRTVHVRATSRIKTSLLGVMSIPEIGLAAQASAARINQGPPVCVLALNQTASGAVTFAGSASFVAEGCAIHSNSSSSHALTIQGSASVKAAGFCAVGGVSAPNTIMPPPERYCDRLEDPFRNLPQAASNGCTYNKVTVQPGTSEALKPGIYCNGLDIKGTATLSPGLYVIKNGPLSISSQAKVTGAGVTFYLTGNNAGFTFNGGGGLDLSSTTEGDYKGMLLVQDRTANPGGGNTINGDANTKIVGAIYAPTQSITVNGSSTFGQATPFMPIIADQIKFAGSTTARADVTAVKTPAPLPPSQMGARLIK
jgi:Flp pilus assembly protein TadG